MHETLIDIRHLSHTFHPTKHTIVKALDDVSFTMQKGEILGLVGESGSGKSTLARCIMNIYCPSSGEILYNGIDTAKPEQFRRHRKMLQTRRQIIFQDCASALDPRRKVESIISEPMRIHRITPPRDTYRAEAEFQLRYVGMDARYLDRYPPELSGGQRQRVAIARALSMEPELLVADEPIASLDVSIQAQIVNLLKHCNREHGCSILFIAHDLSMVEYLCDRVGVMYCGKLVEIASTKALFESPRHPYTKALLSAIPLPDPIAEKKREHIDFENLSFSCEGALSEVEPGHFVLCEEENA